MNDKYICVACDYVYDPRVGDREGGISSGVAFAELPENWMCPLCGVGKEYFDPVETDKK